MRPFGFTAYYDPDKKFDSDLDSFKLSEKRFGVEEVVVEDLFWRLVDWRFGSFTGMGSKLELLWIFWKRVLSGDLIENWTYFNETVEL